MSESGVFAALRSTSRVWAIAAIHGEAMKLAALHRQISHYFSPGDQIVYLGNYSGHGRAVRETIDELLVFRRSILARPGVDCADVVFLRGAQEEMWQKLQQLQFAPNPQEVLNWMLAQGIGPTLEAYGASIQDGQNAARDGTLSLTKWTSQLRQAISTYDGHNALRSTLRHAAYSEDGAMLFVHAGIDPQRPLSAQGDSFWWGGAAFAGIEEPYGGFRRVVRGFDRRRGGVQETAWTLTLDGGCGFGGDLLAACFAPGGDLLSTVSA